MEKSKTNIFINSQIQGFLTYYQTKVDQINTELDICKTFKYITALPQVGNVFDNTCSENREQIAQLAKSLADLLPDYNFVSHNGISRINCEYKHRELFITFHSEYYHLIDPHLTLFATIYPCNMHTNMMCNGNFSDELGSIIMNNLTADDFVTQLVNLIAVHEYQKNCHYCGDIKY